MGDAYYQQRMTRLAVEQYLQAANYFHATGKENELYHPYAAISSCYIDLGENKKAEEYALKSLSIAPSLQAKINSYINLFRSYTKTDNIKKANEIKNILTEYKTQGLIKGSAAENFHIILTRYYYLTKDFAKAMQYSDSIHDEQLRFDCKSKIYAAQGNFKDAYHYCYKRLKLIDSTYQNQNAEILASYNARFNNQRLELEKNRLVLQNTEMRLKQSEDREQLMSMEKEQTRIELENRELQLEQQRTANELEKAENQKQRLKVIQKQEELQRIALKAESNRRKLIAIISSLLLITGFSIIYSITRRLHLKQLQKEMNAAEEARRQAEKADKLKSAFLQNLSHEIRTPLNAIVGFNDLLNDKEAEFSSEERQELLTHIHTNTDLLLTLVNDILDLSKLESGNYNVSLNKVVLTELCQSTLAGVAHRVAEGVNLKLLSPAEEIIITTDAQRLQQILTNLLVNACKYTKQGSITLAYAPENDKIIFSVTDTGCGISKDKSELIFQRFEKLDSINPGFGLGLSICRSLTALLGGRIYLDSDYSKGAKFVVELPL